MRHNILRERFRSGDVALGVWLSIPSSITAETVATAGFDYVCVDMQHGLVDYQASLPMLQAISTGASTPAARVLQNTPGDIGRALDAGAMAVVVPMVNSVAECEAAIAAGQYAPTGLRSYGPTRAAQVEGADYFENANTETVVIPMIETVPAVAAIDDILAVPGVEAIYVGPSDLGVSMGLPPGKDEPEFLAMLDRIVESCRRHDVVPGIHTTTVTAPRSDRAWISDGDDHVGPGRAPHENRSRPRAHP